MFLIVEIISRYIEIISVQNEIILLLFLIVMIISRYIEIISRQNEIIFFLVSNCRDNKSIYRDNKSTK